MERDIRARVEKLAPFLKYDGDPYPVVLGDRTVWILDGYTTTDRCTRTRSRSSGERVALVSDFNYVRNSVKATVDAYEGTVTFYVFDPKDPIIKAWRGGLPRPVHRRVAACRRRSASTSATPKTSFKVQATMFGRYHVTEPQPLLRRQREVAGLARPRVGP